MSNSESGKSWPKRAFFVVVAAGWLALLASGHGVLMGSSAMYYSGKFTSSGKAFETLKCRYWTGLGSHDVDHAGPPGSLQCPVTVRLDRKQANQ